MKAAWEREKGRAYSIPEFTDLGFNYKMSDILAAIGVVQMRRIEGVVKKKQELAGHWDEKLDEMDLIEKPYVGKNVRHVYQSYCALVDKKINRDKLISKLSGKGMQTQIGTYASHIQPVYKSRDKCPVSFDLYKRSMALPMYYSLTKPEIDRAAVILEETLVELK
jgi:dTDP-4-amino-4,6-dideoxygalactose transaminase